MSGDGVRFHKAPDLGKTPELVPKMSVTRLPSNAPRLDPHAAAQTRQVSSSSPNAAHQLASLLTQDPALAPEFDKRLLDVIHTMCGPEFKPDQLTAFIRTVSQCPRALVIAQQRSFYLLGSAIKETYPHARIQRLGFLGEEVLTVDGKTRLLAQKDIQLPGMQKPVWNALKVLMRPEVSMKESLAERRAKAVLAMGPGDARSGASPAKSHPGSSHGAIPKAPVHDTKSSPSRPPAALETPPNNKPVESPRNTAAKEVRAASQAAKPLAASAAIPRNLEDVMQMPVDTKADVDAFYQNVLALAYAEGSNKPKETCARFLRDAFAKFHSGELGGSRLELVVSALAQSLGGPDMRAPMARHFMECISDGAGTDVEAAKRGVRAFALALASDRADAKNRGAALDVIGRGFGRLEDHDKAFLPTLFTRTADDWRDTWLTAYHPESEQPAPKPAQESPVPAASLRPSSGAKPVAKPATKEKVQADSTAKQDRYDEIIRTHGNNLADRTRLKQLAEVVGWPCLLDEFVPQVMEAFATGTLRPERLQSLIVGVFKTREGDAFDNRDNGLQFIKKLCEGVKGSPDIGLRNATELALDALGEAMRSKTESQAYNLATVCIDAGNVIREVLPANVAGRYENAWLEGHAPASPSDPDIRQVRYAATVLRAADMTPQELTDTVAKLARALTPGIFRHEFVSHLVDANARGRLDDKSFEALVHLVLEKTRSDTVHDAEEFVDNCTQAYVQLREILRTPMSRLQRLIDSGDRDSDLFDTTCKALRILGTGKGADIYADAYRAAIRERFEGKYRRQALEAFESGLKSPTLIAAAAGNGNGADSKHSQGNVANRATADKPMDVGPAPVDIVQDGGPSSADSRHALGTKEPGSLAPSSIPQRPPPKTPDGKREVSASQPQPASRETGAASVGKMLDAYRGKARDAKFTAAILAAQDDQAFADAALATYKAWLSEGAAPRSLSQALRNEFVDSVKPSYGGEKNPNLDHVTGSLRALAKTLDPLGPQAIELRRKIKSSFHEDLQAPMLLALNGTTPQDKFEAMERVLLQIEHMDASRDSERYPVYISALRARSGDQRAVDHLVKALAVKVGLDNLCNEFAWILNRRLAQTAQRGGAALHEMGMSALFKALGGPSMTTQAAGMFVKAILDSLDPKESKRLSREPIPLSSAEASMEALGYVLGDVRTKGRSARTEHVLTVIQQSRSAHREGLERAFRDGISRADPVDPEGWDLGPL